MRWRRGRTRYLCWGESRTRHSERTTPAMCMSSTRVGSPLESHELTVQAKSSILQTRSDLPPQSHASPPFPSFPTAARARTPRPSPPSLRQCSCIPLPVHLSSPRPSQLRRTFPAAPSRLPASRTRKAPARQTMATSRSRTRSRTARWPAARWNDALLAMPSSLLPSAPPALKTQASSTHG